MIMLPIGLTADNKFHLDSGTKDMEIRNAAQATEYAALGGGAIKNHINIILTANPIWTKEHSGCSELISVLQRNDRGTRLGVCWYEPSGL